MQTKFQVGDIVKCFGLRARVIKIHDTEWYVGWNPIEVLFLDKTKEHYGLRYCKEIELEKTEE
jgi:hypothetical protein